MQKRAQSFAVTKQEVKGCRRQQKKTKKEPKTNLTEKRKEKNGCVPKQRTQETLIHLPSSRGFQTISRVGPKPSGLETEKRLHRGGLSA